MAFAAGKIGIAGSFLLACGGGGRGCCGCCQGCVTEAPDLEPTVVETPVRAEFAIRRVWHAPGGGRGGIPILVYDAEGVITVHTPVEIEYRADCFAPELHLLVAPEGERVAYRCAEDQPWRVVFLGTEGRSFQQCHAEEHKEAVLDWAAIPDLQSAFILLYPCNKRTVLDQDAKKRGEAWISGALERSRSTAVPSEPGPRTRDPWLQVFETLPPDKRGEAVRQLEGTLERPKATAAEVWRSIVVAGVGERATPTALADAYTRLVHDATVLDVYTAWAGSSLLRALHSKDAPKAAELACTTLTKTASAGKLWPATTLATHALMVLADSPVPCHAIVTRVESVCDWSLDCGAKGDRHLCTRDELRPEIGKELGRPPAEAAADYFMHHKLNRAAYAAALAAGVVPEATRVRNERRHYHREPSRPWCTGVQTSGQPCACFSSNDTQAKFVCKLDANARHATRENCAVTIDDAGKRIMSRRHP